MSNIEKKVVSRKLPPFIADEGTATFSDYWNSKNGISPLRKIRKNRGFTLKRLSTASGISASYLSRIEVKARRMNEEVLRRLCAVLDCAPADLLGGTKEATTVVVNAFSNDFPMYQARGTAQKMVVNFQEKAKWLFRPAEMTAEDGAFALQISEGCESNKFSSGDVVYANPAKALVPGVGVIVVLKSQEVTMGELISKDNDKVSIKTFTKDSVLQNFNNVDVQNVLGIQMCMFG